MKKSAAVLSATSPSLAELRQAITRHSFADENTAAGQLLSAVHLPQEARNRIRKQAGKLIEAMRETSSLGVESFLQQYPLSEKEGVLIMCLAEALLRIPDVETVNKLIRDKFSEAQWDKHLGNTDNLLVNASNWGLMLTGKIMHYEEAEGQGLLRGLIARTGEPVIRQALTQAMKWMGSQFILGRDIEEGIDHARKQRKKGYTHSYDMLGEGARNEAFAKGYREKYRHAIRAIGHSMEDDDTVELFARPGISIKLSALHPRYESRQKARVMAELLPRIKDLMLEAKQQNIMAAIDAEEARRLDISLDMFEILFRDPDFAGWEGVSIVVQAYQKRAIHVLRWLGALAEEVGKKIPVRLVKGAYWDAEIKEAQIKGAENYPVFTRKVTTDLSYLACAQEMLKQARHDRFYPQFATHNANTVAAIREMAGDVPLEFQRLHGMGESLHDQLVAKGIRVRIYAPIGVHKDLLAYLVRRLLENGANSSFLNQLADKKIPVSALVSDPVGEVLGFEGKFHNPHIPLPKDIYREGRPNSQGLDIAWPQHIESFAERAGDYRRTLFKAHPLVRGAKAAGSAAEVKNPADHTDIVGEVIHADPTLVQKALEVTAVYQEEFAATPVADRAAAIRRFADLLEAERFRLMAILVREAGKTLQDAVDEVREAVDFCHYYALQAEKLLAAPQTMDSPTGEANHLHLHARGVFLCISPWNFPLAIFTGQIIAALAAGNCVIAKPSEQTSLIAFEAVRLMHQAGIPEQALALLPGSGSKIGGQVLKDVRIAGVAFTGSTATARVISQTLLDRGGPLPHLIAETGGQNCLIADSSALHEQVVDDVIHSAFGSAGQRCSALRVLCLQEDVADDIIAMLKGAMAELSLGNPWDAATDIGPVIDASAQKKLQAHQKEMQKTAQPLFELPLPKAAKSGTFIAPSAYGIPSIATLTEEHFGPILHIVRFKGDRLDALIDAINATGYGLTLGIHSRIDATIEQIIRRVRVGNIYVNRGMTGAVVGVQPFGGEGLSGTGFKAGGPHYLLRFLSERTVTVNTAAVGGNLELFTG